MASPYGCGESSKKGSLHGVIEKLHKTEVIEANNAIQNSYLPPPRGTQQSEWQATLDRITEKIGPALQKTCLAVGAANCWASDTNRISIIHEPTINAFVDGDHRIGVHSRLIQNASSDEEIAAVIAHEYGHIFAGHIGKQGSNAGLGVLAGIAVGAILMNETGVNQIEDWVSVGDSMGAMAYSQQSTTTATRALRSCGAFINAPGKSSGSTPSRVICGAVETRKCRVISVAATTPHSATACNNWNAWWNSCCTTTKSLRQRFGAVTRSTVSLPRPPMRRPGEPAPCIRGHA